MVGRPALVPRCRGRVARGRRSRMCGLGPRNRAGRRLTASRMLHDGMLRPSRRARPFHSRRGTGPLGPRLYLRMPRLSDWKVPGDLCMSIPRRGRADGRRNLHRRADRRGVRSRTRQRAQAPGRHRMSGIPRQQCLALLERGGRRRRRCSGYHLAPQYGVRRTGDLPGMRATHDTGDLRRDSGRRVNSSNGSDLIRPQSHGYLLHGARAGERVTRHGHYGARHVPVHVMRNWNRPGSQVAAVHAGDICRVNDPGIGDIDPGNKRRTGRKGRKVDIAGSEREPAGHGSAAQPHRDSKSPAEAHPGYQSRSIYRRHLYRSRTPAPVSVDESPTAIVEGGEPPGLVIDPGPPPRIDPNPVAVVVRRPSGGNAVGHPDVAVVRHGIPASVLVEVFVSDDRRRDPAGVCVPVFVLISRDHPPVKCVVSGCVENLVLGRPAPRPPPVGPCGPSRFRFPR